MEYLKKCVLGLISTSIIALTSFPVGFFSFIWGFPPQISKYTTTDKIVVLNADYAVFDKLDLYIEKLAFCESGDNSLAIHYNDGAIGSHSYGWLQYKLSTFIMYVKKYNLLDLSSMEDTDVMNWLLDSDFQHKLTKTILIDEPGAIRNWKMCNKKIGNPPILAISKS